jgi:acetylornithine deacetylase/succinyl-diaminopimelate desuccinylase-like protein
VTAREYLAARREQAVAELVEWLAIPSVSSRPEAAADLERAAAWLAARLRRAGWSDAAPYATGGPPAVVAHGPKRPGRPTVLVYGHYDVQAAEPLVAWTTPPFAPAVRDGRIYARGAADDKGQVYLHVMAAEACAAADALPVNLTFLVEGEEEVGSPHLEAFLAAHRAELAADVAVVSDTPQLAPDVPSIGYGVRGLVELTVRVDGPRRDLHSGLFGGAVANPAHVLAGLLASLYTADGRVAVAQFYDGVREPDPDERALLAALPFDERAFLEETGAPAFYGEPGWSTLERVWVRPTLDVTRIVSGAVDDVGKTIIPAFAEATVTCRLVPDQDPDAVAAAVARHLVAACPPVVRITVRRGPATPAVVTPRSHPVVRAAADALAAVFGQPPAYIRMGGSIPAVALLSRVLGIPSVLLGFASPDEHFHAPDESFRLDNFYRGQETVAALWEGLERWEGSHGLV